MPRLVRRADPLFFRLASLPLSFLSSFVLSASLPPSSPASLPPPCLASTHLLVHHTIHPPCPLSIPVDRDAKQAAPLTSLGFDYVITRLVHSVSQPRFRKTQTNTLQRNYFHYQTVETIRIFYKIVYDGRRRSLPPAAAL